MFCIIALLLQLRPTGQVLGEQKQKCQSRAVESRDICAGAGQTLNAHLQFIPAYTELYKMSEDPDVAARLLELIQIVGTKLPAADGSLASFYSRNWTVLHERTSSGAPVAPPVPVGGCAASSLYLSCGLWQRCLFVRMFLSVC